MLETLTTLAPISGVSFDAETSFADARYVISAPFAISLVFVMYSYSGWNAATYIVGEMHQPQRSLPRSLLMGTSTVIVLYIALNALFLYATPIDRLAGQLDVAVVAGKFMFGDLPDFCQLPFFNLNAGNRSKSKADRNFERGGRAKTCANRHVAVN